MSNFEGVTQKLAEFSSKLKFEQLPKEVVYKIKWTLLDSIGCALGSYITERARLAVGFAEESGGNPQASIIGAHRTSTALAAFVNGELIQILDFDTTGPLTGHVTPYVLPPSLAVAELIKASGKELITAIALAHEVGGRVVSSLAQLKILKDEPPYYEESPRFSYSPCVFGGVAGAGRLLRLSTSKMMNAFGIVGASCPVPSTVHFEHIAEPAIMVKFNTWTGWITQLATTAALLADKGFTGDAKILDGELGFWKIIGSPFFKVEKLFDRLGEYWYISYKERGIEFKQYPCCRLNHTSVDAIKKIMKEHNITADDIERIVLKGDPLLLEPIRMHATVENYADTQFTSSYVCAVAALYGDQPGPLWQMPGVFNKPEVKNLMDKVKIEMHPQSSELLTTKIKAGILPTSRNAIIELTAKGQTFSEDIAAPKGTAENPLTEAELLDKFRNNASFSTLSANKVEAIIERVADLEKLEDVTDLTRLLTIC